MTSAVKRLIPIVVQDGFVQALRQIGGNTLLISGRKRMNHGQTSLYFTVNRSDRTLHMQKFGMQSRCLSDMSNQFINTFYNSRAMEPLRQKAASMAAFLAPVLIIEERGLGKDHFAEYIYANSRRRQDMFYTVDCRILDAKGLSFLLNSPNSPLLETGHTFYFKDIDSLSLQQWQPLLNHLRSIRASIGNQLIFSTQRQTGTPSNSLYLFLTDQLECLILEIPPLRHRIHEMPTLVSLYLNELNATSSRQVAGLEPEGMALLQGFTWPGNLTQFKKVLKSLVQSADAPYIYAESVRRALKDEQRFSKETGVTASDVNINQPLNDIIFEVISQLLSQEGMTQTKAAKQLGICRTTLWKYLNR